MMVEQVGNVKLDLSFYSGNDLYSDGDIENEILDIVKSNKNAIDVLACDNRWPILYHLSPQRRNLLEWYDFREGSSIMEVGAGCGALTGLLCERLRRVVALELSGRRAEIIAHRHKDAANLEVIAGNLNDLSLTEKFDYITLIGVLEYAGKYTKSNDPFSGFLKNIRKYLKEDGVLIVALENRFGLKYWAGACEDHTGRLFDGLEGYIQDNSISTFGKDELTELLKRSGFEQLEYYYPMPDYKMPVQIFSDYRLPSVGEINGYSPNYDQDRVLLFKEAAVYDNLIRNNKFDFFANSFFGILQRIEGIK